jgi:hypothetical protein
LRSRSPEKKHHHSDKKDSRKSEIADDKRRSHRGNRGEDDERSVKERPHRGSRGDKDERSVKNQVEDKKVDTSAVDHKRSSTGSEDEILNGSNSNHKKSRHEAVLEYEGRMYLLL